MAYTRPEYIAEIESVKPSELSSALTRAANAIYEAQLAPADGLTVIQAANVSAALSSMARKANDIRKVLREMA